MEYITIYKQRLERDISSKKGREYLIKKAKMQQIKISKQKPPQWVLDGVREQFGVKWKSGIIFTYGDIISTWRGKMSIDLVAHESHHTTQQEEYGGADKWWREYLDNPKFRFEQELECYRRQYKWLINNIKNPEKIELYLNHYAISLSSPMYGNLSTKEKAKTLIVNK